MASWLSAGSGGEDGTVVRRASAAGPPPNIGVADLFSPSKLESIFTRDESKHSDHANETFSFITPSPTKTSPTKPSAQESSELPSDLSQGTSIGVKPTKRQSLGTGDYLSEASRVMTYLRQGRERKRSTLRRHPSASITPSELYEGPPQRWITPTDPDDPEDELPIPEDLDHHAHLKGGEDQQIEGGHELHQTLASSIHEDHHEEHDNTQQSRPMSSPPGSRRSSVIRSPSRSVSWVESVGPREASSVYEDDQPPAMTTPKLLRSVSKRVDWADPSVSPRVPSPTCETQLEDLDGYPRVATVPNTPQDKRAPIQDFTVGSELDPLSELSANISKPIKSSKIPQYGIREISEPPATYRAFTESQLMRLPPRPPAPTPPMTREHSLMLRRTPYGREVSILNLTPLADFTVHAEDPEHPERSFIDERAHSRALRQAHGALALARDALVQAITDAKPGELYWEQIRYLRLDKKDLKSLHSLDEFCSKLDQLSVAGNHINHLNGIPSTIRALDISKNSLADTVSWSTLRNLQYLDISGNEQLVNLNGLGDLPHLRTLKANSCSISNIQDVMQLDGLLELELRENKLEYLDFNQSQLVQLKRLDASHNSLQKLLNVNSLNKLLDLDVSHNCLSQLLPPNRRGPKLLTELGAGYNKLESFNLKQFPSVKCVFLDQNKIARIHGLSRTSRLESLSVRDQECANNLVNDILSTPNDCRSLALSGNAVAHGRLQLPSLPQYNLMELELSECGLKELGVGFGCLFPNLRNLNLNYNAISDIVDLQGMFKLRRLVLVRNRVRRMRRTCLLFARLPSINEIDLRDNPLTMGFHPPPKPMSDEPADHDKADHKWQKSLDETTVMRRRLTELLLAEHCKNLHLLDGLRYDRANIMKKEEIWRICEERGVVMTPS